MKRLLTSTVLLAALLVPASAQAAPAPAWSLTVVPYPTNFVPGSTYNTAGPAYQVLAINVGGAATSGTFTITDTLPGPLKPSASRAPFGIYGHETKTGGGELSCMTSGHKITCTGANPPVGPGEQVRMSVPVDVEASAPPQVLDKASIEGGGAPPAATSTVTTIDAVPAPFGLLEGPSGLFGSTTAADGSTLTQAGGHPYQQTIAGMNFTLVPPEFGFPSPAGAGGGIRDVVAELPRGTVVNPGATPVRCREKELERPPTGEGKAVVTCPESSQVGTIMLSLGVISDIATGPRPLFNMVPPSGSPAELGFEVNEGIYGHLLGHVSADGSFQLSAASNDLVAKVPVAGVAV
jgi:hypothetical protein